MFQYRKRYALLQPLSITNLLTLFVWHVSIPQAVRAVATSIMTTEKCHNYYPVSIPQAVRAVATAGSVNPVFMRFQKLVLENLKP